jgi:pSer/pThr/pTyr-binding forkhead associated (FHA) protein
MTPIAVPPPAGVDDTLIMGGVAGAGTGGAEAPAAPGGAELKIQGGPDLGHTFRVGEHALRIGRSPDNDLILRDPATSGHHARLERRGAQWFIVDLGSTNGTLVNGEPVQEKELKHQDEIKIGQNVVSFNLL